MNYPPLPQERPKKSRGTRIIIITLIIAVLALGGYTGYDLYSDYRNTRELQIYTQGQRDGAQYVQEILIQRLGSCQKITLTNNQTQLNVVAVECLRNE